MQVIAQVSGPAVCFWYIYRVFRILKKYLSINYFIKHSGFALILLFSVFKIKFKLDQKLPGL